MKKIVFATGNMGKMREIREIMEDSGYEIVSMKEAGVDPDIVEALLRRVYRRKARQGSATRDSNASKESDGDGTQKSRTVSDL